MTTTTAASSQPPTGVITPFRKSRHASPPVSAGCPGSFMVGWINTFTSWPLMEV